MDLKNYFAICLSVLYVVFSVSSCSGPKVTRINADEAVDLSGYWNDTDSKTTAQAMIDDSFANDWINEFHSAHKRKPRIIIGNVVNKTEEHINCETFVKDLELSLINTRKVTFVVSKEKRNEIRAERDSQSLNASADTIKRQRMEMGADFVLQGQINSIFDQSKKAQLKYYQVELEIIDMETTETVWIGQKKIKKVISKKYYKV